MKKNLLLCLMLVFTSTLVTAQSNEYKLEQNIRYYNDSVPSFDKLAKDECVLDIYYPEHQKNLTTVIWFHGGGLTGGKKEIPEVLKKKGLCIVGVGYRLSPQVKCPTYIQDAAAAVAWVFQNIARFGGNPDKIVLSGHSAGGYLSCMLGLDKKWLAAYHIDANRIAGLVPFSAQTITHFTIRKERGIPDTQAVVDEFAPLFHARKDAPPLLLITGDREMELLGRYEENAYLYRMMKLNGHTRTDLIELQGYDHNMTYPAFPLLLKWLEKNIK